MTVAYPNCDGNHWVQTYHNSSIYNIVTLVQDLTILNLVDCCNSCQTTLNCIGGSYSTNICALRIKIIQTVGLTPNNMCPLAPYVPTPFSGTLPSGSEEAVFKGPCAY